MKLLDYDLSNLNEIVASCIIYMSEDNYLDYVTKITHTPNRTVSIRLETIPQSNSNNDRP